MTHASYRWIVKTDLQSSALLFGACLRGELELAKFFITNYKINPESGTENGWTPLQGACKNGHLQVAKYLIADCKCNPECIDDHCLTPLHYACCHGHLEVAKYLITECNCNPECTNDGSATPLHCSCQNGHLEVIKYLIGVCKCDPECIDDRCLTPLHYACNYGHLEVAKYLSIEYTCNPECTDKNGTTPLHYSCRSGHLEVAKYLITECNCNPECTNDVGSTPLHYACELGHLDIARYLIENCKCNPECKRYDQGTAPLHFACRNGNLEVVKYLITECNCSPECTWNEGNTPLHCACETGQIEVAKYLITECNCCPASPNHHGTTTLHRASASGQLDILKYLISEVNYNPDYYTTSGKLPHAPCRVQTMDEADFTLRNDICTNVEFSGTTLLHSACENENIDVVKYLYYECKINPESKDASGYRPLHGACWYGCLEVVKFLVTEGKCQVNCRTGKRNTPLHFACANEHTKIVEFLLSTGECDPLKKNKSALTPLHLAKSPEVQEVMNAYYDCKIKRPIESYIKMFVVGDPGVGKSSLVKALQNNPGFLQSLIGQFQQVKQVSKLTAGIDSFAINSKAFGNIVIHDFAGQKEYHSCHAAFLQGYNSHLAGIFFLVVDVSRTENHVKKSLSYWMSFIQNCWAHNQSKAHVIIVGSHADQVRSDLEGKYDVIEETTGIYFRESFTCAAAGVVCMNCKRSASAELDHLRSILSSNCAILRKHTTVIDRRCYMLYVHINKQKGRGSPACTVKTILKSLEDNPLFKNAEDIISLLKVLDSKGQIVLLLNSSNRTDSWIITDRGYLLQVVVGTIFAPKGFSKTVHFKSTGIVPYTELKKAFSHLNLDMIIDFMKHFEFCIEVKFKKTQPKRSSTAKTTPHSQIQIALDNTEPLTARKHYLFPVLIRDERPPCLWKGGDINQISYHCGWYICCTSSADRLQFFADRFLHVLLFRLAFNFALQDQNELAQQQIQAVNRKCQIWRNGIWWSRDGVAAHFEVLEDNQVAVLIMACLKKHELKCVKLRSQLIQIILQAKEQHSHALNVKEYVVNPNFELKKCNFPLSLADISIGAYNVLDICDAISKRDDFCEEPDVVVSTCNSIGTTASKLLYFDSYTNTFNLEVIAKLLNEENQTAEVTDYFFKECAESVHSEAQIHRLQKVFTPHPSGFYSALKVENPYETCYRLLKLWKDEKMSGENTYKSFRQEMEQYSIFRDRNPLAMAKIDDGQEQLPPNYLCKQESTVKETELQKSRPPPTCQWLLNHSKEFVVTAIQGTVRELFHIVWWFWRNVWYLLPVLLLLQHALLQWANIAITHKQFQASWFSVFTYSSKPLMHSTLPEFSGPIISMENEAKRIQYMLADTNVSILSIHGYKGTGKSTLAIDVGRRLVSEGLHVHYVDIREMYLTQDGSAKHQKSTGNLFGSQCGTGINWNKKLTTDTHLILDNCDLAGPLLYKLLSQIYEFASIKTILTRRTLIPMVSIPDTLHERTIFYEHRPFKLHSSTKLLQTSLIHSTVRLSTSELNKLVALSDNSPLAVKTIAGVLNQAVSPRVVIDSITKLRVKPPSMPLRTFPKAVLPPLWLSYYNYSDAVTQKCAVYLSLFPGSFTQEAAVQVLASSGFHDPNHCLQKLSNQSLLEHYRVGGQKRFLLPSVVKDFFTYLQHASEYHQYEMQHFNSGFQEYFTYLINSTRDRSDAVTLKYEGHNIRYLHSISNATLEQSC